jgi:hypothetical protein
MRPPARPVRIAFTLAVALARAPLALGAQQLAPVADAETCHGERIVSVVAHGARRAILGHPEAIARAVNDAVTALQPLTPSRVVLNFVLLKPGDSCDEGRRRDSERILRSQPYISDAAIRAEPVGRDSVRLVVETIDEYMIFAEAWGLSGVPVGAELGTGNLFDGARAVSATAELGRGDALGGGIKYTDYQTFGEPLRLDLYAASRPLARYSGASLTRPFLTDFQPYAWLLNVAQSQSYYMFHQTSTGEVSLEYDERSWAIGGLRRWPHDAQGFQLGAVAAGTYMDPIQPVVIGHDGPEPVFAPELMARYHGFSAVRVGAAAGYRDMRFIQVSGLDDLSAVQDVGIGWQSTAMALQSLGVFPGTAIDQVGVWNLGFGAGSQAAQLRGGFEIEARMTDTTAAPVTTLGAAHLVATVKTSLAHTTMLDVEVSGGANARIPMQLTFRDDDGLLGYRSSDLGGGQRTIWRFEDRWLVPVPYRGAEFAVAALVQAGKLEAGDALYGVTTPWQYGAGVALMGALPRGSKHMVRLELGWPLNPAGPRQMEFRISYGDRGAAYDGTPNAILQAREAAAAARAVTP